jgi:hypothetical protein
MLSSGTAKHRNARASGDLAENQILAWKIVDYQSGPALSAGGVGPRKGMIRVFKRSLGRLNQRLVQVK